MSVQSDIHMAGADKRSISPVHTDQNFSCENQLDVTKLKLPVKNGFVPRESSNKIVQEGKNTSCQDGLDISCQIGQDASSQDKLDKSYQDRLDTFSPDGLDTTCQEGLDTSCQDNLDTSCQDSLDIIGELIRTPSRGQVEAPVLANSRSSLSSRCSRQVSWGDVSSLEDKPRRSHFSWGEISRLEDKSRSPESNHFCSVPNFVHPLPVKVENCDAGKKNIPAPAHLKSLHNPEDKGYLDESPGSSIRAAGSDSDFDSDRENEKFTSLKRTYSRSSIASHITDFRDKIKVSLTGDLKKVQADNNTKLKLAVLFFFSICLGIVVTSHVLYNQQVGEVQIFPEIKLLEAERRILMKISDYDVASDLGVNIPYNLDPYDCLPGVHHNETVDEKCAEWKDKARLIIKRIESEESLSCYKFFWQALTSSISPMDCWSPNLQGNWYGGGERLHMSWPLERSSVKLSPFVTGDEDQTEWGNVIKRYFINSLGVSLRISDETPLSVSLDPVSGLCLKAHYDEFPYYYHKKGYPQLNYTVCTHESLMHLYSSQLTSSFWDGHKESDLQELRRLLKLPLWQLPPARNGQPLDMNYVSTYIKGILGRSASITRGESRGYLLIDSSWQQNMGDLLLSDRLRDLERTVSNSGLTLVLTLTPFVSTDSTSFNEGLEKGLFVMERKLNITRDIPALTWYKNVPAAALLDITNNQTVSWIKSRLRDVVSVMPSVVFFVETGNAFHTPHYFQFEEALYNPDLYKDLFISVAMTEIKVIGVSGASSKRPKAPAFVHLTPLASNWDSLRTIIPNVLNLGVIGYPFVSTGPVGGDILNNATNQTTRTSSNEIVPESELFIRWWQLATFMPQIHFTTPPTQYRNKYMPKVAENLKFIKEEVVNPELIRFSQIAMENSAPVIRPLWMLHSDDSVAQTINDEFLIGDKILVAPVLDQGKVKRNVYLPRSNSGSGVWKRGTDGTFFEGGQWLNDSLAPLETVLYFIRQPDFARPDSNLS